MANFVYFANIVALLFLSFSGLHCHKDKKKASTTVAFPEVATSQQLRENFQGSASVSMLDTVCMAILLKTNTALAVNCGTISNVFVLTTRIENNVSVDGETYKVPGKPGGNHTGRPINLFEDGLMTYKFGPLGFRSDAVPATVPPFGSEPPAAGKQCVAYTYTKDTSGNVAVSYSPVTIADPKTCGGNSDFFCIQITNPESGTNAFVPVLVYCRSSLWKGQHYGQISGNALPYPQWLYAGGLQQKVVDTGAGSSGEVQKVVGKGTGYGYVGELQKGVGTGAGSVTTYRMFYITNLVNVAIL